MIDVKDVKLDPIYSSFHMTGINRAVSEVLNNSIYSEKIFCLRIYVPLKMAMEVLINNGDFFKLMKKIICMDCEIPENNIDFSIRDSIGVSFSVSLFTPHETISIDAVET